MGRADSTRKKDKLHHMKKFGKIHPHIDSYLMTRTQFMASPYDERYSGALGGGSPFLALQAKTFGESHMLPDDIHLHVYTAHHIEDSSITELSRDKAEYIRRKEILAGKKPSTILHHPWHLVDE